MNLSKFFIDRPIFAGVLSVLMVIAGLIALRGLPISEYPEVAPPSVVVRAQYPGANPKVIAETVATMTTSRRSIKDLVHDSRICSICSLIEESFSINKSRCGT